MQSAKLFLDCFSALCVRVSMGLRYAERFAKGRDAHKVSCRTCTSEGLFFY
jgi:hypothetical protein